MHCAFGKIITKKKLNPNGEFSMKLVLCNVNPYNKFNRELNTLAKLQIDNSIDLGWKLEDIIMATNFDYEYKEVQSTIVDDKNYCNVGDGRYGHRASSHIFIIENLFRLGLIKKNELYFYHDFDAYQVDIITEEELKLGNADIAVADYGWSAKWNLGVIFFRQSAYDIFRLLKDTIFKNNLGDERSLCMLTDNNQISDQRYKRLNIRYNFGMRNIGHNFQIAQKPLKILHFHPLYHDARLPDTTMNLFFHGKNEINKPLLTERLKKIFRSHGLDESYGIRCTYRDFRHSIAYE